MGDGGRWLKRQIEIMDRSRARPSRIEPERLILAPRPGATTRRICLKCRRPFDSRAHYRTWWDQEGERLFAGSARSTYSAPTNCPECGGEFVDVTA